MLVLTSCHGRQTRFETVVKDETSGFILITDTVMLDTKLLGNTPLEGEENFELRNIVKYRGQYKLLFYKGPDSILVTSLSATFKSLGDVWKAKTPLPRVQYFFVRNDSLLLSLRQGSYLYLNCDSLTSREIQLPTRLSKKDSYEHVECYQDEDYVVDYLDDGEFGQFVTFFDQKSDSSSSIMVPMHHIRRWHGAYYLISPCNIFRIDNPLEESEVYEQEYRPRMRYRRIDCIEKLSFQLGTNGSYSEILHLDYEPSPNTYIAAYVHKDQLYVVENRKEEGLILKQFIEPDSLTEVLKISEIPMSEIYAFEETVEVMSPSNQLMLFNAIPADFPNFLEFSSDTLRKVFLKFE